MATTTMSVADKPKNLCQRWNENNERQLSHTGTPRKKTRIHFSTWRHQHPWWRTSKQKSEKKVKRKFIYLILMDFNAIACWLLEWECSKAWRSLSLALPPCLNLSLLCRCCQLQLHFVYCCWLCNTQRRRVGNLSSLFPLNASTHSQKHGEKEREIEGKTHIIYSSLALAMNAGEFMLYSIED